MTEQLPPFAPRPGRASVRREHVGEDEFAAFASGLLSEDEQDAIAGHLAVCDRCLDEMESWLDAAAPWGDRNEEQRLTALRRRLAEVLGGEPAELSEVWKLFAPEAPPSPGELLALLGLPLLAVLRLPVPVRVRAAAAEPVERETPDGALRAVVERLEDGALVVRVASVRPEYAGTPVAVRLGDWTSPPRPLEPAGPNAAGEEQYGARFEVPKEVAGGASAEELEILRLATAKQQG